MKPEYGIQSIELRFVFGGSKCVSLLFSVVSLSALPLSLSLSL